MGKHTDEDRIEDAVRSVLLQVEETLELESLELIREGRTAKIYFTVRKNNGEQIEVTKDVD